MINQDPSGRYGRAARVGGLVALVGVVVLIVLKHVAGIHGFIVGFVFTGGALLFAICYATWDWMVRQNRE